MKFDKIKPQENEALKWILHAFLKDRGVTVSLHIFTRANSEPKIYSIHKRILTLNPVDYFFSQRLHGAFKYLFITFRQQVFPETRLEVYQTKRVSLYRSKDSNGAPSLLAS